MMKIIGTILFMAAVGAIIGSLTNRLAITMLFRPHHAKYIGKWKVPFTPGLIPKRRDELAEQLGRTVAHYLLTPELLREKILTDANAEKMAQFLTKKGRTYIFDSEATLNEWLERANATHVIPEVEQKIEQWIDDKVIDVERRLTNDTIEGVVPERFLLEVDERIPMWSEALLTRGEQFVQSEEGYEAIQAMLNEFLASKGTFGQMAQMLFGDSDTLVRKFQKEALKFLRAENTSHLLEDFLSNEWYRMKHRRVEEVLGDFPWGDVRTSLKQYAVRTLNLEERLDVPLRAYWPTGGDWYEHTVVPQVVDYAFVEAEKQFGRVIESFDIEGTVKDQVNSFSLDMLERLVIDIANKELKMITWFGGLLGGTIGIVQGIIVILTT